MGCPKCFARMETVRYQEIEVERCTGCQGLWFENMELEKLAKLEGSEKIDTGDPKVGKLYDDIRHVDCPLCSTPMIRMVDSKQHHIWFEACTSCGGMFFDAGEFRDYKERTVLDFIEDLLTRERR